MRLRLFFLLISSCGALSAAVLPAVAQAQGDGAAPARQPHEQAPVQATGENTNPQGTQFPTPGVGNSPSTLTAPYPYASSGTDGSYRVPQGATREGTGGR